MGARPRPVERMPDGKSRHIGPLDRSAVPHADVRIIDQTPIQMSELKEGDYVTHLRWPTSPDSPNAIGVFTKGGINSAHVYDRAHAPPSFVRTKGDSGRRVYEGTFPIGIKRVQLRHGDRWVSNEAEFK